MKKLYDISRTLSPSVATWEGDTPFSLQDTLTISGGDSVNVLKLTMSIHTATHIDAPYHFDNHGEKTHDLDLAPYWGLAQVISIQKAPGELFSPEDLAKIEIQAPRILVHSFASSLPDTHFPQEINYPSLEFVQHLKDHAVMLFGTDAPSMDAITDATLPAHHALHHANIALLEGLNLSDVPDGLYELTALPIKIQDGDGSPVRAVLREI